MSTYNYLMQYSFPSSFLLILIFFTSILLSLQLCDPSHKQLEHWSDSGPRWAAPWRAIMCLDVFLFSSTYTDAWCLPHTCTPTWPAPARPTLSARSGFNWMIGTLRTLNVSVIQTLSRSHRLLQAPPLSFKANPLSPVK